MGIKDKLMNRAASQIGGNLVQDMKKAQKESNDLVKQLNTELHELAELVNQVLDSQNEIIKGTVSNYKAIEAIAEFKKITLPKPLADMEID